MNSSERARSSSRSRSHSRSLAPSTHEMGGTYEPGRDSEHAGPGSMDFCNSFWGRGPVVRRTGGAVRDGDEEDWGRDGYETVLARIRTGTKVLEDLKTFYKDR